MKIFADFAIKEQMDANKYTRPLISFHCIHCDKIFNGLGSFFWSFFSKLNLPETDERVKSILDSFVRDLNQSSSEELTKVFSKSKTIKKLEQQLCFCDESKKIDQPKKTPAQKLKEGTIVEGTHVVIIGKTAEFEGLYKGRGYINGFIRLEQVIIKQANEFKEAPWVVIREEDICYIYPFNGEVRGLESKPKVVLAERNIIIQKEVTSKDTKQVQSDQIDLYNIMLKMRVTGVSWTTIAKYLTNKGILTPSGKSEWSGGITRHAFARLKELIN